ILVLFVFLNVISQETDLLTQRNQLYQEYRQIKDTMTSRTWMNMVNLSNKLEQVVILDGLLLDSLLTGTPTTISLETQILNLANIRDLLLTDNSKLNGKINTLEKTGNLYKILFEVCGVLLLLFIVTAIILFNKSQRINTQPDSFNDDILKLKNKHKEEVDKLKDEMEKHAEEKLLLENNALEIKKSFDILKSEKQILAEEVSSSNDNEIEEIREEMKELGSEVATVLEEKDELEEALGVANQKLAHQIDANKKFEEELQDLFQRFKRKED
ncbi:MAG: hypothetical protein GY834_11705, partial [Bacteroidetes bacterium]|nr:hypothetical protein [Bacteroidota bacterium]